MKKVVFLVLLIASLATSCNPESKFKVQLDDINTYTTKLDSLKQVINGIEIDSLVYMQKEAEQNEKVIKTYYAPDTIDVVFAEKLNLNKGVRKTLKGADVELGEINAEIDTVKIQFTNLKTDILNGLLNEEQTNQYLNAEKEAFENVSQALLNFDLNQKKQKNSFYYATPQISVVVEELLNENKTE